MDKQALLDIAARYCDRCGTKYNVSDVEIVRDFGGSLLLMLNCHNCGASHMVNFIASKGVGSRLVIHTDLFPDEMREVPIGNGVESNVLLDLHMHLNTGIVTLGVLGKLFGSDDKLKKMPVPKIDLNQKGNVSKPKVIPSTAKGTVQPTQPTQA